MCSVGLARNQTDTGSTCPNRGFVGTFPAVQSPQRLGDLVVTLFLGVMHRGQIHTKKRGFVRLVRPGRHSAGFNVRGARFFDPKGPSKGPSKGPW